MPWCTAVVHVPSNTVLRAAVVQLPKTPSPLWFGLSFGWCGLDGSLRPSFTSMSFAEAPKARAMLMTWVLSEVRFGRAV